METKVQINESKITRTFAAMHANINGFKTHAIDVETEIELMDIKPEIILLNETKLDEADPSIITGYSLIFRKIGTATGEESQYLQKMKFVNKSQS